MDDIYEIDSEYTAKNGKTYSVRVYVDGRMCFARARRGVFANFHTAMNETGDVDAVTAQIKAMADSGDYDTNSPAIHFRRAYGNPANL